MRVKTAKTRFHEKVWINLDTGCWEWRAGIADQGYGQMWIPARGQNQGAHRVAYELYVGQIPGGLQLDHLCRMRHCVNPEHLEPVTGRENLLRGQTVNAANAAKTHCMHGHEFSEVNTYRHSDSTRDCRICRRAAGQRYRARLKGMSA